MTYSEFKLISRLDRFFNAIIICGALSIPATAFVWLNDLDWRIESAVK